MAIIWFALLLLLLPLFTVAESHDPITKHSTNQSDDHDDLQAAMADMRARSYHGFVILLKLLNTMPIINNNNNTLQKHYSSHYYNLTFFMPNDEELSNFSFTNHSDIQDFMLSHSIPTPLVLDHLLHLPNGSVLPSSIPTKMISITNSGGRLALFVNNARITTPNVCTRGDFIRCHGISAALAF